MSKIHTRVVMLHLSLTEVAASLGQSHWIDNDDLAPDWVEIKRNVLESNTIDEISDELGVFKILCPKALKHSILSILKSKSIDYVWDYRKDVIRKLLGNVNGETSYEGESPYGEKRWVSGIAFGVKEILVGETTVEIEVVNLDQLINQHIFNNEYPAMINSEVKYHDSELEKLFLKTLADFRVHPLGVVIPNFKISDREIVSELKRMNLDDVTWEVTYSLSKHQNISEITNKDRKAFTEAFPEIDLEILAPQKSAA